MVRSILSENGIFCWLPTLLCAVKALLAKGADVNARHRTKNTPLIIAAGRGRTEIVNVSPGNRTAWCAHRFACSIFDDNQRKTIWVQAKSLIEIAVTTTKQVLLSWGAEVQAAGTDNLTALMLSSANGHLETVKVCSACPLTEYRTAHEYGVYLFTSWL